MLSDAEKRCVTLFRRETSCQLIDFESVFHLFDSVLSRGENYENFRTESTHIDSALLREDATSWNKEGTFAPLPRNIVKRRPSQD